MGTDVLPSPSDDQVEHLDAAWLAHLSDDALSFLGLRALDAVSKPALYTWAVVLTGFREFSPHGASSLHNVLPSSTPQAGP